MQKRKAVVSSLILALSLAVANPAVLAAVPSTLNYQGQLGNAAGAPVNGTVSITFSLYDVASGGAALWSETQNITVMNGLYHTALGQITPLTPTLFGMPLFLGIKVGNDAEMTPRSALGSSATALRAQIADSLSCTGCVTAAQIAGAAIASAIPAGSITAQQLAPGVIPAAGGAVTAGTLITSASTTPPVGYGFTGTNLRTASSVWVARGASLPPGMTADQLTALNGKPYAIGIMNTGTVAAPVYTRNINEYDAVTDAWLVRASLPAGMIINSLTALNGKLYAMGNMNTGTTAAPVYTSNINEYDAVTDAWLARASLPTGMIINSLTALNGKFYAMCTMNTGTVAAPVLTGNISEYDAVTNTWLVRASLPAGMMANFLTALNGKLYTIGSMNTGTAVAPVYTSNINEYDAVTDTWLVRASLPAVVYTYDLTALNGKLYTISIMNMGTAAAPANTSNITEYDAVTDAWLVRASPAIGIVGSSLNALNGRFHVIGQANGMVCVNRQYDPVANTWAEKTPPRSCLYRVVAANNKIYTMNSNGQIEEYDAALDFPVYVHFKL